VKKRILPFALVLILALTFIPMPDVIVSAASTQSAAESESFTPVWTVPPPLNLTDFWLCICGEFVDSQERIIDRRTGRVTNDFHGGHGGGPPGWVFDPTLNMLGHPIFALHGYSSYIGMHPVNEFEQALARSPIDSWESGFFGQASRGLIVVAAVDSTMRQALDWEPGAWALSQDAFSGKSALMYNRQLTTDFEFDSIQQLGRSEFDEPVFELHAAKIGDMWGLIDRNGNSVIPFVFSNLILIDRNTAFANFNGSYGILNLNQTMANAASIPPTPALPHNLNAASTWAHEGITASIELGLVPQDLRSNYRNNATREEFAALAVALYETATGAEITGRMQFNDTNDINVQKMGYLGVVTGVGNGNFAPNSGLTREQAAVMLARLAEVIGQPLTPSTPTFADNTQISSWAIGAVGQIQAAGIMGGVGNNQFSPQGDYTREQSIITILRMFEMLD